MFACAWAQVCLPRVQGSFFYHCTGVMSELFLEGNVNHDGTTPVYFRDN